MPDSEVVVVGAGLAGLACALRLLRSGVGVRVLEAADGPGGRVRTDLIDGYRCDRGFQLLNPSYPAAKVVLDLPGLDLQPLPAGVAVHRDGHRWTVRDPRRSSPLHLPATLDALARGRLAGPLEALGFARYALRVGLGDAAEIIDAPDGPWGRELDELGINGPLRTGVIDRFLSGTLGEGEGVSSRRFVDLLVRSFVRGTPSVPAEGMQAMPDQLARRLPEGCLQLGVVVRSVTGTSVATTQGTVPARAVVVATDPVSAAELTGVQAPSMRPLTTLWHTTAELPEPTGLLHVDADRTGPIANSVVLSSSAPRYAPAGRHLVATTVLTADVDAGLEKQVLAQLARVYGTSTADWQNVQTNVLPRALTVMDPPLDLRRPNRVGDSLFVAGDHRDTASIQGALVSGRRAALAVLTHLGLGASRPEGAER